MNPRAVFLSILIAASYIANAQDMHSLWLPTPVQVDGNPQEWPQPFRYYDPDTKLQYAVANDSANIYICLKVTDEAAQMKLFRAGINIWLDPKGKKKETVGVSFPMKAERGAGEEGEQHHQRQIVPGEQGYKKPDIARLKQRVMLQQIALKISGFNNIPDQVMPIQNNYGITAAINWDSLDILCIEYKIPIVSSLKHNLVATDTLKPVGLGFIVNAIETKGNSPASQSAEEDAMHEGTNNNRGSMGGMNGGMGGGGMGGGGYGGGGGGMRGGGYGGGGNTGFGSMAQEEKVWSKLTLSLK